MTFIYKLDIYIFEIYRMCDDEFPMSSLSQVIVLQTDMHDIRHRSLPGRFADDQ